MYQINDFISLDREDEQLAKQIFRDFDEVLAFCGESPKILE
nr:hypothetical protein [Enterococcus florum]